MPFGRIPATTVWWKRSGSVEGSGSPASTPHGAFVGSTPWLRADPDADAAREWWHFLEIHAPCGRQPGAAGPGAGSGSVHGDRRGTRTGATRLGVHAAYLPIYAVHAVFYIVIVYARQSER